MALYEILLAFETGRLIMKLIVASTVFFACPGKVGNVYIFHTCVCLCMCVHVFVYIVCMCV